MTLEDEIINLGQSNNSDLLKALLSKADENEVNKLIESKIISGSFLRLWNFILKGLSDKGNEEKKNNIIIKTLKLLDQTEIPSSQMSDVVSYIIADSSKQTTECLIKVLDFCSEGLQNIKLNPISWQELLPEIVNILSERESIHYNGSQTNGVEFKKQFINYLCMLQWSPERMISIASMFCDMTLNKDEHLQVVNKLCSNLEKLTPQEIPGFIFQLLKLCRDQNCKYVFIKLQMYFSVRIYETSSITSYESSDSTDLDTIESASHQDLLEAESTILFHIHSLASSGANCLKEYLLYLKNLIKAPEFILHPFQITLLLTISTVQHYEEKIFEIIKSSVSRFYHEQHKRESSLWFQDLVQKFMEVESIFNRVLTLSLQDRDTVLQGLVNFAFVLLGIKTGLPLIFIDPIAEKQWNLGIFILVKIVRHKRLKGRIIIQEIINNILTDQNVRQYIECLHLMSRNLTLILLENQSCIIEVMEDLTQIPGNTAIQLLDAIVPLTKVSSTIRDHLILLLRKALYSSKTEIRQMAVVGYIKLLTTLKISNTTDLSQLSNSLSSFSSGHSLFTQLSLNRSSQCSQNCFTNESLCLEILTILRRCFMQRLEVKQQLYEGLLQVVHYNSEITYPVLDMLWVHFSNYYIIDEEAIPPIDYSKISVCKGADVIQQEPIGKLLVVIGLILVQENIEDQNATVRKFRKVFDSMCDRMTSCELVHLQLDDGTDLSDILPECKEKVVVLQEAVSTYESLIAYKINSWNNDSSNGAQVVSLFQGYNRLLHFSKNIGKSKKEKKKKNDSDTSVQQNISTQKKDQKHNAVFKLSDSVLDFQTTLRALQLLHEPIVEWTTMQEANCVKSKVEIHRHFLQTAQYLLSSLKGKKYMDTEESKRDFVNATNIAEVIYFRCIKTLSNYIDFDCTSSVLAAECFQVVLNYIFSAQKKNILLFLRKIVRKENESLIICLSEVIRSYQKIIEMEDEMDSDDQEIKKISLLSVNTLATLSNFLPTESTALSIEFYDWLKDFANSQTIRNRQTATHFFNLFLSMHFKYKKGSSLINDMVRRLALVGGVTGEIQVNEEENSFKVINELSFNSAYICITNAVKMMLDEVDWLIARLKSEYAIILHAEDSTNFRRKEALLLKEKGISCQLCFVVSILENMTEMAVQPGTLSEALLKIVCQLYTTLTNLTKYFNTRSTRTNAVFQGARFEKLVKFVGRGFSPSVNNLISNLEEESKKEQSTQTRKKASSSTALKSKIMKDTKSIPKLVYGMEQFSSCIIQLSNKTKIDLSKHIGQGTTRDFRILLRDLDVSTEEGDDTHNNSQNEVSDDSTESETTQIDDTGEDESRYVGEKNEEEELPPQKKKRIS